MNQRETPELRPRTISARTGPRRPGRPRSPRATWRIMKMTPRDRANVSARQSAGTVAALAALALVSGCTVGPDFRRPAPPAVDRYTRQPLVAKTASADVAGGEEQ